MWSKDAEELSLDARVRVTSDGQLTFSSVVASDSGRYTCTASNELGMEAASTVLSVQGMSGSNFERLILCFIALAIAHYIKPRAS